MCVNLIPRHAYYEYSVWALKLGMTPHVVITMSVMPPFTYPNISLCSHGVITVLCDLEIFLCPTNRDAMRVHRVATPSIAALRPLARKKPSARSTLMLRASVWSDSALAPTRLKLRRVADFQSKTCEGVLQVSLKGEGSLWFTSEGDALAQGSLWSMARITNTIPFH
jgi:hypothetical protein